MRTNAPFVSASLAMAALVLLVAGCAPPKEEPTAKDALAYFGIADGKELSFTGAGGLTETHTYEKNNTFAEREAYDRLVRRGGFAEDDSIFTVEATLEGLQIVRFYECLNLCGEPSEPVKMLPWPVEGGEATETDLTVAVTRNNVDEGTREERHRFQVGSAAEEVTVPAGTFEGFTVLWARTIDGETTSSQFVFVPDVGVVVSEGFDGMRFELAAAP